jgi:ABC-type polysaccharide/polyol phosphate transport system ATPase subunit
MTRVILEDVSVEFPIYGAQQLSLRYALAERAIGGLIERDSRHKNGVIVKALSNVDLKLEDGDRLGLVGHNGSGKSTLLKVIAGIYEPVSGKITVNGRVTPLFDMMPGLDVDDSGYENILTSGLLLGMTREQVIAKIPEIEEVSELGDYLSLPVRTYSAGMTTRLGFALVTALDPDVLVLDEGFGAADLRFTNRTAERVDELIGRSRAMVLASHSDAMLQSICNKAALMKEGKIISVGPVEQIFDEYHFMVHGAKLHEVEAVEAEPEIEEPAEPEEPVIEEPAPVFSEISIAEVGLASRRKRTSGEARFTRFLLKNADGATCWSFKPGDTMTFACEYETLADVPGLAILVRLLAEQDGVAQPVTDFFRVASAGPMPAFARGSAEFTLRNVPFRPMPFKIYASLTDPDNTVGFDVIDDNVALPDVVIEKLPAGPKEYLGGVVSMACEFAHRTDSTVAEPV